MRAVFIITIISAFAFLGPSAMFVGTVFAMAYRVSSKEARRYRATHYQEHLINPPDIFDKNAFNFVDVYFYSKETKKAYFLWSILSVFLYSSFIGLLSKFFPGALHILVLLNTFFTDMASCIFPTISTHYQAVQMTNPVWAKALREIYSVFYMLASVWVFTFLPQIRVVSDVFGRALSVQTKWMNRHLRYQIVAVIFLALVWGFFFLLMYDAEIIGGPSRRLYNVTTNNLFFYYLYAFLLMPMLLAYVFTMLSGILKFYLRWDKRFTKK